MLALFSPNAMTEKIVWRRVPEDEDHPIWTACINSFERLHWMHLVTTVQCLTRFERLHWMHLVTTVQCLTRFERLHWMHLVTTVQCLHPFERLHWMHLVTTVQCFTRLNVFTDRTWSQPCSALPVYTSSLDTFGHPVCVQLGSLPVLGPIRAVLSLWLPSTPICVW